MNVNAQKFQSQYALVRNSLAWSNHRMTLPQSALSGCQLPQRGSRGRAVPFNIPLRNRNVAGDFHRPYATQKILVFTIHRSTLPQSRPCGRDSSLREGAGNGWFHSSGYSLKSYVAGDFHRPYETQKTLHSTIQRKNHLTAGGMCARINQLNPGSRAVRV